MSGAFQTSREIFDNPIWKNVVDFRLFFLIYGQAVFSNEGVRLADDLVLQRGQWCRSLRNLQKDLEYVENRQVKTYSLSVLNRCISRAVASQRLCTKTHELGTVFTVVNYELYQGFGGYKKYNLEQDLEHSGNSRGTVEEQSGNNNKNVKKEKNDKNDKKEYHEDTVELTNHLIDLMKMNNENVKIPTSLDKWHDEMDKLERIDKYDYIQIRSVIDWCQQDSFWKGNILSVPKLREKIGTLVMQMQRPKAGTSGKVNSFTKIQQMYAKAEEDERREANGGY